MSVHIAGTYYVPEGRIVTVELPSLRTGNGEGRTLLFRNRGEIYVPCYIKEADSDDLLLLNQYSAERFVESVRAAVEYGDVDPSDGVWEIERTETDDLLVNHRRGPEGAADAM